WSNAHHKQDLCGSARRTLPQQRPEETPHSRREHRRRSVDGQQKCQHQSDAQKCVHLGPAQLAFLFLDQAFELVEEFAIVFAERVDDAGKHRFNSVSAVTEQSVNHVFLDTVIELVARDHRHVNESAAFLATFEQFLFKETVERGHQGCVSDTLFESEVNVSHADFTKPPGLFHDLAFQLSESETGDFARPAKSTQQKSRGFHIVGHCRLETIGLSTCCCHLVLACLSRYHCWFSTSLDSRLYA